MKKYKEQMSEDFVLEGYTTVVDVELGSITFIPIATENRDYQEVLAWIAEGNTPDPDDTLLAKVKQKKIGEYKTEGINRIRGEIAEWDSFEVVGFLASIWNMLGTPNASQNLAKNIFVYTKNTAIPAVKALTTVAAVQAVDVVNDPNWP